jgi:predicted nucleic-acid-binding protein
MNNLLDANAILRYLLNDIPEQASIVEKAIKEGACTTNEALAEVIYVLLGVYKLKRKEITDSLLILLEEIDVLDKRIIKEALRCFTETSLDYVDCILYARAKILNEKVISFDKKLNKLIAEI